MTDQVFVPLDLLMWNINTYRRCCCGESNTCNIVFLGLRMLLHFSSALTEFIILNISHSEYARYDSPSTGLFGWIMFLIIIMPLVYIGCLLGANVDFMLWSWAFKVFSIFYDIFFLCYTVYITKTLQGNYGKAATLIIIDIAGEFSALFFVVIYFSICNCDNEVVPS